MYVCLWFLFTYFPWTRSFCSINRKRYYFAKTYQLCFMLRSNWIHNFVSILPCRCYACYETKYLKRNAVGCKYISKQGQRIKREKKIFFAFLFFLVVRYDDFRPFFNTSEFFGVFHDHKLNPNNFFYLMWLHSLLFFILHTWSSVLSCYYKNHAGLWKRVQCWCICTNHLQTLLPFIWNYFVRNCILMLKHCTKTCVPKSNNFLFNWNKKSVLFFWLMHPNVSGYNMVLTNRKSRQFVFNIKNKFVQNHWH